jgi:hypothetical protein
VKAWACKSLKKGGLDFWGLCTGRRSCLEQQRNCGRSEVVDLRIGSSEWTKSAGNLKIRDDRCSVFHTCVLDSLRNHSDDTFSQRTGGEKHAISFGVTPRNNCKNA